MSEATTRQPLNCELIDYSVLSLHSEVLRDRKVCKPLCVDPDVRFELGKPEYKAFVYCRYCIDGFDFACGVEGSFRYCAPITSETLVNAWFNACTMIYGILRGVFTTSISQAMHQAKFLPAVMMIDEINNKLLRLKEKSGNGKMTDRQKQIPANQEAQKES